MPVSSLSCRAGEEKKGVAIMKYFTMMQNRFTVGIDPASFGGIHFLIY